MDMSSPFAPPASADVEINERIRFLEHRIANYHASEISDAARDLAQAEHVRDLDRRLLDSWRDVKARLAHADVEIGGQAMTKEQFDAARFPLQAPDPGPVLNG